MEYEDAQGYAQEQGQMPLIEISAMKGKNVEMLIKIIKNRLAKHRHLPNNEQKSIIEDRIMSIEDRIRITSGKSQDKNTDTAHFQTDHHLEFSEASEKHEYNRRQLLSQILDSHFYKSPNNELLASSPIEPIEEDPGREQQTLSLNDIQHILR